MNANPDKKRRHRIIKTRSRFTTLLTVYFVVALIVPNFVLANTEPYSIWTIEALLLMPLGFYMMWSVALRRSGVMIWIGFPFIFFCAFQIVLLYLFGQLHYCHRYVHQCGDDQSRRGHRAAEQHLPFGHIGLRDVYSPAVVRIARDCQPLLHIAHDAQ